MIEPSVDPNLAGDTGQSSALVSVGIDQMIKAGGESLIQFGHLFLPRTFRMKSPPFHYEMGAALDGPRRLLAFQVFREGAKTSILRTYAMRRIAYCLSNVIMIVSAKAEHAALTVQWIRNRIEGSALIREAFRLESGKKFGRTWTNHYIEIVRTDYPEDDPRRIVTVFAAGLTGQIRGFNIDDFRPDLILLDDGQTEESVGTAEQSEKTSDLTFGALQNSLVAHAENPQAKFVILQTPMSRGDVIDIVSKSPLWTCYSYGVFDKLGKSRWEERYPTAQLLAEKAEATRMGKYSMWMREKEVTLVKSEVQVFDMEKVRIVTSLPDVIHDRITAIDPASSESKKADNQVCMTVLRTATDYIIVASHAARGEMPDALAQVFFQQFVDWRPRILRIESVAYQRVLAWYLEKEMLRRRLFVTVDKVQDQRKKSDRIIQACAGVVAQGRLALYAPTGILDPSLQTIYEEMAGYEPGRDSRHDDHVDALSMALDGLNNPASDYVSGGTIEQAVARERKEFSLDRRSAVDVEDEAIAWGAP